MHRLLAFLILTALVGTWPAAAQTDQGPATWPVIKTDHPRDTMATFMSAMNDYRRGKESADPELLGRIDDAVACLELDGDMGLVGREQRGREAAIFLKEVIDRWIVIDLSKIPAEDPPDVWRLRGTEVRIGKVTEGDRAGQYLFTAGTVRNARGWYVRFQDKPYLEGSGQGALYQAPWVERNVPEWSRETLVLLPNWQWLGIFLAILVGLLVKTIAEHLFLLVKKLTARSETLWDDKVVGALDKPVGLLAASAFWFFALYALQIEGTAHSVLAVVVQIVFSAALVWSLFNLADVLSDYLGSLASKTESLLDDSLVPMVKKALRIFVVIFGVLFTVQNLGFNVMSVLAGLGLGGLAFALAARDTCANFFGSIMILLDRPFQIGHWVKAAGVEGTVEDIGFRSTRIRTFYNSVISVPNASMANASIDNMGRREYRRIVAHFGVTYDTPAEKIEAFIEGIKNIVKANPYTRKDYYHVVFNSYGDFNLDVMLYCFLKVPDWGMELVERQNIYLEVLRLAQALEIEFAFPTQTLHMETFPGQEPTRPPHQIDDQTLRDVPVAFGPNGTQAKPGGLGYFVPPFREAVPVEAGTNRGSDEN